MNNLDPSIWGPYYWNMLHFMSSAYDNNPNPSIKASMKNFIQSLPVILPCEDCQDHAFHFIKSSSSNVENAIQSRKDLFTFFFNFHNFVNKRLNKPLMELEDALKKYSIPKDEYHLYNVTPPNDQDFSVVTSWTFVTILIISLILVFLYKFYKF